MCWGGVGEFRLENVNFFFIRFDLLELKNFISHSPMSFSCYFLLFPRSSTDDVFVFVVIISLLFTFALTSRQIGNYHGNTEKENE